MRTLSITLALLVALALVAWLVFRSEDGPTPSAPRAAELASASASERPREPSPVVATVPTSEATETDERRELAATPSSTATAPSTDCNIFGRVVDESDRPLAGVRVLLQAYPDWATGHAVPLIPGSTRLHGYELFTDASGAFRIAAPTPTVERVSINLEPDVFHDSARETHGSGDTRSRSPLHAGDNDLGTYRLVATGAIAGNVRDENGAPLANAKLRIAESRETTLGREATSDASGRYVIGHVVTGSYGVAVKCDGYLSRFEKPFDVTVGRITDGVDFALRVGPTLAGRVVDEAGNGLAGAKLWGWPTASGSGAGATSQADGSFTIQLPQDEPYTLEVKLEGFDTFGLERRGTRYAPNSRDLRIVLKSSLVPKTRFVIVDMGSGAPVERFGLEIESDRGTGARRNTTTNYRAAPAVEVHSGGVLEATARPSLDTYTVVAPGYVRASGDVEHDLPEAPIQTLRLVRGGGLSGRVVRGGKPVASAAVRLELGAVRTWRNPGEPEGDDPRFDPQDYGVSASTTASDGGFRFDGLEPGVYRLTITSSVAGIAERMPLELGARGDLELGDVELGDAATIVGRVIAPPRRPLAGLTVYLDDWRAMRRQTTDADGRFRFDGVVPGKHAVTLEALAGQIAAGEFELVELAAGETHEVVLDASERGTCDVRLTLELPGLETEGVRVALLPLVENGEAIELGRLDAQGRVAGSTPACGEVRVKVTTRSGARLIHPTAILTLALDRDVEEKLRFELATLELALPPSATLPAHAIAKLTLAMPGAPAESARTIRASIGGEGIGQADVVVEDGGRRLRFGPLLAGTYELTFEISDLDAKPTTVPEGNGFRFEPPVSFKAATEVTLRSGEATRVQLD